MIDERSTYSFVGTELENSQWKKEKGLFPAQKGVFLRSNSEATWKFHPLVFIVQTGTDSAFVVILRSLSRSGLPLSRGILSFEPESLARSGLIIVALGSSEITWNVSNPVNCELPGK